jgi:hypothetical protein
MKQQGRPGGSAKRDSEFAGVAATSFSYVAASQAVPLTMPKAGRIDTRNGTHRPPLWNCPLLLLSRAWPLALDRQDAVV